MKNKRPARKPTGEPRTAVSIGSYRYLVTHAEFLAWERHMQDRHGFKPADIIKALRERIGL